MKNMDPRYTPKLWAHWLETRQEFLARVGWCTPSDHETVTEYRALLVALRRSCTIHGIARQLGIGAATIQRDRMRLGITEMKGGPRRPHRLFGHKGKMMTCQQVADMEGCGYNTAYSRLTTGEWA